MDTGIDMQAVQNFLRLAKGAQTKDDFITRVRQFDQKFIDAYPAPTMTPLPNIPRSNSQSGSNFKTPQQPPKNPFINSAEQKYRIHKQNTAQNQFLYQQGYPPQQPPSLGVRNKPQIPNLPHSRSQINFYRQQQQFNDDLNNISSGLANQFYNDQMYRQNMQNRSYSYQPQPKSKNPYVNTQPYIQNNQFLPSYQTQQPEYVKYYKQVIPQPNPKTNYSQTPRSNPFK